MANLAEFLKAEFARLCEEEEAAVRDAISASAAKTPPPPPDHTEEHAPNPYLIKGLVACERCGCIKGAVSMPCPGGDYRASLERRAALETPRWRPDKQQAPATYDGPRTGMGGLACGFVRRW